MDLTSFLIQPPRAHGRGRPTTCPASRRFPARRRLLGSSPHADRAIAPTAAPAPGASLSSGGGVYLFSTRSKFLAEVGVPSPRERSCLFAVGLVLKVGFYPGNCIGRCDWPRMSKHRPDQPRVLVDEALGVDRERLDRDRPSTLAQLCLDLSVPAGEHLALVFSSRCRSARPGTPAPMQGVDGRRVAPPQPCGLPPCAVSPSTRHAVVVIDRRIARMPWNCLVARACRSSGPPPPALVRGKKSFFFLTAKVLIPIRWKTPQPPVHLVAVLPSRITRITRTTAPRPHRLDGRSVPCRHTLAFVIAGGRAS